jgi:hypothetical protein
MRRDDAIEALRRFEPELRARGATALYLFGSTARDEAGEGSDVDLFLDYQSGARFTLVTLCGIANLLEDRLGHAVDLTTRKALHPAIAKSIIDSAIKVF